ncbi:MAG: chorismate synthase, partial [Clostridia bacterium]|nr:chorismate synthase [Clostridia bacterium]
AILNNRIPMIDPAASKASEDALNKARMDLDSLGSTIETVIYGLNAGIGQPGFESLESKLAAICFGVPGVKGIEFGKGFGLASMKGSSSNDPFYYDNGIVKTRTNNMGGILGGISNGMPVGFTVCMKPTSSISREQESIDLETGESAKLVIEGRHDPCIGIRAVPVMEACAALAVLDSVSEE